MMAKAKSRQHETTRPKVRVLIVDDHPVVRAGLRQRLQCEADLGICGESDSMLEAYGMIADLRPDIVLLDIALKEGSGLDLLKEMRARGDTAHVLVMSHYPESSYAERCLKAGAQGYLQKDAAMDDVVNAIKTVMNGDIYLSADMTSQALRHALGNGVNKGELTSLSDRELQVYDMIGKGMTISEIAQQLLLSTKTIETYRAHLKNKLNLRTSAELARHAYEWSVSRQ